MMTKKETEDFRKSYIYMNSMVDGDPCYRRILNLTHTDNDGDFSHAILNAAARDLCISVLPYRTGYEIDTTNTNLINLVSTAEEVWITDLNLPIDTMENLVKINPSIDWFYVDHHDRRISTEDADKIFGKLFTGYRYAPSSQEYGYSACYHVYDILRDLIHNNFSININQDVLDLISDRDTWKLRYKETTDAFHYGLMSLDLNCNSSTGIDNLENILSITPNIINLYIEKGKAIMEYNKNYNNTICDSIGFKFSILGYNGFCVSNFGSSDTFGDNILNYDLCCLINLKANKAGNLIFKLSLYSSPNSDVDCAAICAMFGGGGHFHAAGFTSKKFPFKNVGDKIILLSIEDTEESDNNDNK